MEDRQKFVCMPKPPIKLMDFLLTPHKFYSINCCHCDTPFCTVDGEGWGCGHEEWGLSIVCFHLHIIRLEQTKWGKLMFTMLGLDLLPFYCVLGVRQFIWLNLKKYFIDCVDKVHTNVWTRWRDEDDQGNPKSMMKLAMDRWCAIYCCVPWSMLGFYIVVGFMGFIFGGICAPFVALYLEAACYIIYLMKLCKLKNIWVTKEDLLK